MNDSLCFCFHSVAKYICFTGNQEANIAVRIHWCLFQSASGQYGTIVNIHNNNLGLSWEAFSSVI